MVQNPNNHTRVTSDDHLHSIPPLISIVLSRLNRGIQSATDRDVTIEKWTECCTVWLHCMRLADSLLGCTTQAAVRISTIPQHKDRGDESGQWSAACGRQRTEVSSMSARPNCRLWYRRPRAVDKPAWATVRVAWRGVWVVSVVAVWQNISCRVQRQHVVHHLHRLLSAARLSTGPAVVHCLHIGPCSYSGEARHISTRVCWRHAGWRSCIYIVVAPTRRQLLHGWNSACVVLFIGWFHRCIRLASL